jgi:hypothetical protein
MCKGSREKKILRVRVLLFFSSGDSRIETVTPILSGFPILLARLERPPEWGILRRNPSEVQAFLPSRTVEIFFMSSSF